MEKAKIILACTISFAIGGASIYMLSEYVSNKLARGVLTTSILLKNDERSSEAFLTACYSVANNDEGYYPLIIMGDILNIEGNAKEMVKDLYSEALYIAKQENSKQSEADINRLQTILKTLEIENN